MNAFSTLLHNPTQRSPADVQIEADRRFSDRLAQSELAERQPDSPIPDGIVVVLGIATYSLQDLKLLDDIDAHSADWSGRVRIEAFNVLLCHSHCDFARYLPGFTGQVFQTPIVGVWKDELLVATKTGEHATRSLLQNYHVLT